MKKYLISIAVILVFLVGLSVLLYPTISAYVNSRSQSRVVAMYYEDVSGLNKEDLRPLFEAAREYNASLLRKQDRFTFTEEETAEYNRLLNTGCDIMGVLFIDKINVRLPIYHGTSEGVLQVGIGHLQGSSLPVGGLGTHTIVSGHRGLPSSTLLTYLDKMEKGDVFVLYILGEELTYQVDQITVVEPSEVSAMDIDPEMDYCTLVTCTPYGINSHRLLVRGHRIENVESRTFGMIYADAERLDKPTTIMIFIVPVLLALMIYIILKCKKIHQGGKAHR